MKIVYDGHIFRWQKVGGISRYFREIISRLPNEWSPTILGVEKSPNLPDHANITSSSSSRIRPRSLSQPIKKLWWKRRHIDGAAVFHPTYYNLTGGLQFHEIKCPIIITVHDLIAATYPHLEDNAASTMRDLRHAIGAAAHVVCVSRATEGDLLTRFPRLAGKTSVIYHGSSFPICEESQQEIIFDQPTFLYVGRRATYKNFQMLVRAFSKACQSHATIRLCTAGAPLTEEEKWQIHFLGISDRVDSIEFPREDELRQLYRTCVALLYPSRHEGFGIPPLEAMACGTLAVCSNSTSLPEVVGTGGIMLDPEDEAVWADCILAVANQNVPRAQIIARGRARATELSWDASAKLHLVTYNRFA